MSESIRCNGAAPRIEPGTSRTRSENHATRPSSQLKSSPSLTDSRLRSNERYWLLCLPACLVMRRIGGRQSGVASTGGQCATQQSREFFHVGDRCRARPLDFRAQMHRRSRSSRTGRSRHEGQFLGTSFPEDTSWCHDRKRELHAGSSWSPRSFVDIRGTWGHSLSCEAFADVRATRDQSRQSSSIGPWAGCCPVADMTLAGLEPAIFGSEDQRLIH